MPSGAEISRVYAHPLRQRILEHLRKAGPCTQTELARALDMAPASARHHLLRLVHAGFAAQAKTRIGPHGITERLFEVRKSAKGKRLRWSTRHGSAEDLAMRKLSLDEVLEVHRVGSRIILRDPKAFFSIQNAEVRATREELRRLRNCLQAALAEFLGGLPAEAKRPQGQELQSCRIHVGLYPDHPPKSK